MVKPTIGRRTMREFYRLLETGSVQTIYQPVMPFSGRCAVGYEALSRGPVPYLASPMTLFEIAEQVQVSPQLDAICCRRAIENFPMKSREDALLFINLLPETLEMGGVDANMLSAWTESSGIAPGRVVLEVTEKQIADPARFYTAVANLRVQGFRFAVDDVGTGYSNLSLLADLVPEFFKLDLEFVRLTRARPVRQLLVETLVRFAGQIGAMVVAEGIETDEDAEVFRLLGVPLGQGFLYRPA
ncbi:EAL domain-containing protein [Sulfobacillus harzensis]|uniref:EAL domain-containing protein n=1 Tax=Sulfobacillus harzensis TaxID=2729629 RepID=A0A7Y0Q1C5_9FIRM|nr:EAL domain-containing protein [Sulfobacillus harzensis]NMP21302.1 EAL domain-containing protein [Sulfobacillus harzensis]